jgi:hypothetical protein
LSVISDDVFYIILPLEFAFNKESEVILYIKFDDSYFKLNVHYADSLYSEKYQISRFFYKSDCLPFELQKKIAVLFNLRYEVQKRREIRLPINENLCKVTGIKKSAILLFGDDTTAEYSLKDISFSGARCIVMEKDFKQEKHIVIKIDFQSPIDSCFVFSEITRTNKILLEKAVLIDIGLQFIDPVDLEYQKRIQLFFDKAD